MSLRNNIEYIIRLPITLSELVGQMRTLNENLGGIRTTLDTLNVKTEQLTDGIRTAGSALEGIEQMTADTLGYRVSRKAKSEKGN